ncbi:MAG: septum formation family protein [Pseudomonadota bacterium]
MKTTIHKRTLLATIVVACLTACGGGSGGGGNTSVGTPPPTPTPPPADPGDPVVGSVIEMEDSVPGTCTEIVGLDINVEYLKVVDCNQPHTYEVAGVVDTEDAPGTAFPGDLALSFSAHRACRPAYEAWVGQPYTGEDLAINTIIPSRSSWRNGDRSVICLITSIDGSMLTAPTGG